MPGAGARHLGRARHPGQAEVGDAVDAGRLDQDVAGLDVAVDHVLRVDRGEAAAHLRAEVGAALPAHRARRAGSPRRASGPGRGRAPGRRPRRGSGGRAALMMFGCRTPASARASRMNRASWSPSPARCGSSDLIATSRSRQSVGGPVDRTHAAGAEQPPHLVPAVDDRADADHQHGTTVIGLVRSPRCWTARWTKARAAAAGHGRGESGGSSARSLRSDGTAGASGAATRLERRPARGRWTRASRRRSRCRRPRRPRRRRRWRSRGGRSGARAGVDSSADGGAGDDATGSDRCQPSGCRPGGLPRLGRAVETRDRQTTSEEPGGAEETVERPGTVRGRARPGVARPRVRAAARARRGRTGRPRLRAVSGSARGHRHGPGGRRRPGDDRGPRRERRRRPRSTTRSA